MARTMPMGVMVRRDPGTARMVGVSALAHATVLALMLFVLPLMTPRSLPIVAYTVELTDSSSLGGRLAPGRSDLPMGPRGGETTAGEAAAKLGEPAAAPEPPRPPAPEPKPLEQAAPPEPAPVEPPKPVEPAVRLPSPEKPPPPKPEAKKPPEPKPEPKVEPKPAPKPEATKKAEAAKPESTKPESTKPEPKASEPTKPADATAKTATSTKPAPADAKPAPDAKAAGKPTGKPDGAADGSDAYAASAQRWRSKGATGGGGGLGGTDTSPGPMGTPGYGGGGGGQVVGFEFLAYQQRVVSTVKGVWTNAAPRPGLVTKVRFQIAPNGEVSGVRIEQSSGDGVFDGSALRAVQRADPLPPPPARYVNEFREFVIEFHSEEGGSVSG